jgi:hypothetical protein
MTCHQNVSVVAAVCYVPLGSSTYCPTTVLLRRKVPDHISSRHWQLSRMSVIQQAMHPADTYFQSPSVHWASQPESCSSSYEGLGHKRRKRRKDRNEMVPVMTACFTISHGFLDQLGHKPCRCEATEIEVLQLKRPFWTNSADRAANRESPSTNLTCFEINLK